MSSNKILHPEVLWAQRANELYITIMVTDCKDPKINVTKDKISFEGKAGPDQSLYGFELETYEGVKFETAKSSTSARSIFIVLEKTEQQKPYWPRLHKEKGKIRYIKTDFSRWKDEDEDEDEGGPDPLGGMDFSNLMGGDADSGMDDSDEEMPGLETVDDDTKPDDTKPDDTKPDDTKPDDTKPDDTKPDETTEKSAEASEENKNEGESESTK